VNERSAQACCQLNVSASHTLPPLSRAAKVPLPRRGVRLVEKPGSRVASLGRRAHRIPLLDVKRRLMKFIALDFRGERRRFLRRSSRSVPGRCSPAAATVRRPAPCCQRDIRDEDSPCVLGTIGKAARHHWRTRNFILCGLALVGFAESVDERLSLVLICARPYDDGASCRRSPGRLSGPSEDCCERSSRQQASQRRERRVQRSTVVPRALQDP
jgi:hypothetical protein